jgi:hypothetical protein
LKNENPPKKTLAIASIASVTALLLAYWYLSPYLVMRTMRVAAEQKDAQTFNQLVDYPQLRESIKGQMAVLVAQRTSSSPDALALAGAAMAMAFVNPLIDALVRPEIVMHAMSNGQFALNPDKGPQGFASDQQPKEPSWRFTRTGVDQVIAHAQEAGQANGPELGMVFQRTGLADWWLTELRIPMYPSN